MGTCAWKTCGNELTGRQTKFCSNSCSNNASVDRFRRNTKTMILEVMGGACERCGYTGHQAAFDVHHRDHSKKEFGFGSGNTPSRAKVLEELKKCHLLCRNCHSTIHATNDPAWVIIPL